MQTIVERFESYVRFVKRRLKSVVNGFKRVERDFAFRVVGLIRNEE